MVTSCIRSESLHSPLKSLKVSSTDKSLQENLEEYVTDGICYSLNDFLDNEVM
jgi:hypothetical protein